MKYLIILLLILYLYLLGVFQSGDDQIDYNDPEVMRAWEEVYYDIDQFNIIHEPKIDSTFIEKDSLSVEPLEKQGLLRYYEIKPLHGLQIV